MPLETHVEGLEGVACTLVLWIAEEVLNVPIGGLALFGRPIGALTSFLEPLNLPCSDIIDLMLRPVTAPIAVVWVSELNVLFCLMFDPCETGDGDDDDSDCDDK